MFDHILEVVKKTGIFLVLAQTVLHLCANDAYEKYIKMIVGLITAIMLIFSIVELIRDDGLRNFETYRKEYEEQLLGGTPDFEQIKDEAWEHYYEENAGHG